MRATTHDTRLIISMWPAVDTRSSLRRTIRARAMAPGANVRRSRERHISRASRDDYGSPTEIFLKSEYPNGTIRVAERNLSAVEDFVVRDPAVAEPGLGEDQ